MAQESKFQSVLRQARDIDVAGIPVGDVIGVVSDVFKRRPNVRQWAQAKREEKRRLKAMGLTGQQLRAKFRQWQAQNPKPQGSEPYNPVNLGQSAQMDGNAMALNMQNGSSALPNIGTTTKKAGFKFSPFLLLLAVPFLFPKQVKQFRRRLKI